MGPLDQCVMGVAEISAYCGVSKQTVVNWRQRMKLPEPCAVLALGPVWSSRAILRHFGHDETLAPPLPTALTDDDGQWVIKYKSAHPKEGGLPLYFSGQEKESGGLGFRFTRNGSVIMFSSKAAAEAKLDFILRKMGVTELDNYSVVAFDQNDVADRQTTEGFTGMENVGQS